MTITSRAFSPDALLHHALHAHAVVAEHLRDLRQHAGPVLDLEVQVEGRLDLLAGHEAQLLDRLELHARRAHHRHHVAEHRRRGLRPAGARARERHLGDRLGLERDGVEGPDHRGERVAAVQEAREHAHADAAVAALGHAEQLQHEPELLRVVDVVGGDLLDALERHVVERHRGVEREPRQDRHLRRRVLAVHVLGRVGLRVAELLRALRARRA